MSQNNSPENIILNILNCRKVKLQQNSCRQNFFIVKKDDEFYEAIRDLTLKMCQRSNSTKIRKISFSFDNGDILIYI